VGATIAGIGTEARITRRSALTGAAGAVAVALLDARAPAAAARKRRSRSFATLLPDPRSVLAKAADPADLGVLEAASLLQARMVSSVELTSACLRRAEHVAPAVNAWIRLYHDDALADARTADRRLSHRERRRTGRRPPLVCGVPLGLKEIYDVAGHPMTAGSKVLAGNVAVTDAAVLARLRRAGMVVIGHTQTHEFAAGNFTPQSANPWDVSRTPGGSSGGSAAALALRAVPAATGSDTLGSLRIPAGLCGVTAIKPTRGLLPLGGLVPLAHSYDHAGPLARSAADAALLLGYMTTGSRYLVAPGPGARPLAGLRVGVPTGSFGGVAIDAGIAARFQSYVRTLGGLGATLVSFAAPTAGPQNLSGHEGFRFFLQGIGAEIDAYHRRWFPQRATQYTPDVAFTLSLLRAANTVPAPPSYVADEIAKLRAGWEAAFAGHRLDVVAQPAAVVPAPKKSQAQLKTQSIGDPMVVWDYLGWPVVCVVGGKGADGLPVGVQLVGRPGTDARLCSVAITADAHAPHFEERPSTARF
jgi:aspartyl-tRNA(Asn)/glutamyl-tRNA(Gln) amidotransferase subunit A